MYSYPVQLHNMLQRSVTTCLGNRRDILRQRRAVDGHRDDGTGARIGRALVVGRIEGEQLADGGVEAPGQVRVGAVHELVRLDDAPAGAALGDLERGAGREDGARVHIAPVDGGQAEQRLDGDVELLQGDGLDRVARGGLVGVRSAEDAVARRVLRREEAAVVVGLADLAGDQQFFAHGDEFRIGHPVGPRDVADAAVERLRDRKDGVAGLHHVGARRRVQTGFVAAGGCA